MLLDYIYTNNSKYCNFSGIVQYGISDHLPTFIFVHNTAMKNKVLKDIIIRDMKNFSLELFCNDLLLRRFVTAPSISNFYRHIY